MSFKTLGLHSILILMASCLLFSACGKKTKETSTTETYRPPVTPELDDFLNKQQVICELGKFCPEYMVKVVVIDRGIRRVCTGFLTDSETIATSTSCLPSHLWVENQGCERDVYFFFPKSYSSMTMQRRGCAKVLKISDVDDADPVLWKDDLAFLSLDKPILRRSLFPTREGLPNKSHLTMWSVDHIDDYFSVIRRDVCEVVHNTYFNPLASNEYSSSMTVGDCEFKRGNSGSPLIDDMGLVRAVVTATVDQRLVDYVNQRGLLTAPLKPVHLATNFSCVPTIYDTEVANEVECGKIPTTFAVDQARSNQLSFNNIFAQSIEALKASIEKANRFIRFSVKVSSKEESVQTAVITPKCFKDVSLWIQSISGSRYRDRVTIPSRKYKMTMDSYARIRGQEVTGADEKFEIQFSPDFLRAHNISNLYVWNTESNLTYEDFPQCN